MGTMQVSVEEVEGLAADVEVEGLAADVVEAGDELTADVEEA